MVNFFIIEKFVFDFSFLFIIFLFYLNVNICSSKFGLNVNGIEYEKKWSIFLEVKMARRVFDYLRLLEFIEDRNNGLF